MTVNEILPWRQKSCIATAICKWDADFSSYSSPLFFVVYCGYLSSIFSFLGNCQRTSLRGRLSVRPSVSPSIGLSVTLEWTIVKMFRFPLMSSRFLTLTHRLHIHQHIQLWNGPIELGIGLKELGIGELEIGLWIDNAQGVHPLGSCFRPSILFYR